jgi:hypothetical protein
MDLSKNFFDVTRRNNGVDNKSLTFPANAVAMPRGTAYIEGAADASGQATAVLADGTKKFAGFTLVKVVTDVSASLTETVFEMAGGEGPLPAETPYFPGQEGAFEKADEYIAEGTDHISSTGGASDITPTTAVGTKCSFLGGKTCKATTGQIAEFYLAEQLTPIVAGNVRARFAKLEGVVV